MSTVHGNPIRVWLYRGWCVVCDVGRTSDYKLPHWAENGYPTPGQAADAGRRHLRDHAEGRLR